MADAAQQWGRRALDFVDAVERLSAPDIVQLFEAEITACGFHAYIMAGLPSPGTLLSDLTECAITVSRRHSFDSLARHFERSTAPSA
jgi:hypothetical protein